MRIRACSSYSLRVTEIGSSVKAISYPYRAHNPWAIANKIGLSPPPIETPQGWLVIYHGVRHTGARVLYRVGLALFDLKHPEICLKRGNDWVFGPEAPYEQMGDVGYVAFPCGYTIGKDGDSLNLFYGAADTCIALATASIRELLAWLDEQS